MHLSRSPSRLSPSTAVSVSVAMDLTAYHTNDMFTDRVSCTTHSLIHKMKHGLLRPGVQRAFHAPGEMLLPTAAQCGPSATENAKKKKNQKKKRLRMSMKSERAGTAAEDDERPRSPSGLHMARECVFCHHHQQASPLCFCFYSPPFLLRGKNERYHN